MRKNHKPIKTNVDDFASRQQKQRGKYSEICANCDLRKKGLKERQKQPGEQKGFKFIIPQDNLRLKSTRVCTLEFKGDAEGSGVETKQIVLAIK